MIRTASPAEAAIYKDSPTRNRHSRSLLIVYAWAMEIVGVGCGVINATYTTFGGVLPTNIWAYVPAVPMVVLAVAELGRVPLASAIFHKHKLVQGLAALAILALSYLAVENWSIGFERLFGLRFNELTALMEVIAKAEASYSGLQKENVQITAADDQKRKELADEWSARNANIESLMKQKNAADELNLKKLKEIRDSCRIIREKCMRPETEAEMRRYEAEVAPLNNGLESERGRVAGLQEQINGFVKGDNAAVASRTLKETEAANSVKDAHLAFDRAAAANPIYQLATSWFHTSNLTAEQLAITRWWFSTMSAIAVALTGSVAALVHYSGDRIPGAPSLPATLMAKVAWMARKYYARKRKAVVREVPVFKEGKEFIFREGKEIVVKEVERKAVRIVLVPTRGIERPFWINWLWRREGDGLPQMNDLKGIGSNVVSIEKKGPVT
jgi:hypothetical protein